MQAKGRDAGVKEEDEQSVPHGRSPRTFADVVAGGRLHWRIEQRDPARGAQSSRELDVFHQRNPGKATQPFKNFAAHEDRLVAVKRSPIARQETPE